MSYSQASEWFLRASWELEVALSNGDEVEISVAMGSKHAAWSLMLGTVQR